MINNEKILIYKKYEGDLDAWARIATFEEKKAMSDDDWYLIDNLIQNVVVSRPNIIETLKRNVENEEVMNEILGIAMKLKQR